MPYLLHHPKIPLLRIGINPRVQPRFSQRAGRKSANGFDFQVVSWLSSRSRAIQRTYIHQSHTRGTYVCTTDVFVHRTEDLTPLYT